MSAFKKCSSLKLCCPSTTIFFLLFLIVGFTGSDALTDRLMIMKKEGKIILNNVVPPSGPSQGGNTNPPTSTKNGPQILRERHFLKSENPRFGH